MSEENQVGGEVNDEAAGTSQETEIPDGLEAFLRRAGFVAFRRTGRLLASQRQAEDCARTTLARLWLAGPPEASEDLAVELIRRSDLDCLPLMTGGEGLRNEWLKHMERNKGQSPDELALRDQLVDWLSPLSLEDQALLVHHYVDGIDRDLNAELCGLKRANVDRRLELFAEQVAEHLPEGAAHPFPADSAPASPDHFAAEKACLNPEAGGHELAEEQERWRKETLAIELPRLARLIRKLEGEKESPVKRLMSKAILAPAIAATLAVGLALLAAWPSDPQQQLLDPDRDPLEVQMVVSRAFKTRNLDPAERLHPGDVLAYKVALPERYFVVVAGLSPEGKARFPFARGPLNWPVGPRNRMLPVFTPIDASRPSERIFFFFCKEPPEEPEALLELLEQAYPFDRQGRRDLGSQRLQNTGNCEVRSQLVYVDQNAEPSKNILQQQAPPKP